MRIGIIDSGLNVDMLSSGIVEGYYNFSEDRELYDCSNHGSWVTSKIKEINNNSDLFMYKVISNQYGCDIKNICKGLRRALSDNLDVINISMGSELNYQVLESLIKFNNRNKALIICASGNNYNKGKYFPSCYDTTLSIGSINSNHEVSVFSNRNNVDIYVEGENIEATINGTITVKTGTSMSCAVATGYISIIVDHMKKNNIVVNKESVIEFLANNNLIYEKNNIKILDINKIKERW